MLTIIASREQISKSEETSKAALKRLENKCKAENCKTVLTGLREAEHDYKICVKKYCEKDINRYLSQKKKKENRSTDKERRHTQQPIFQTDQNQQQSLSDDKTTKAKS